MKIALVQCPSWSVLTPPYNLALLSSCLKQEGHEVHCFDFNIQTYKHILEKEGEGLWGTSGESNAWLNKDYVLGIITRYASFIDSLAAQLLRVHPQIIGFSVQDTTWHFSEELIKRIKGIDGKIKILLGGYSCFGNPPHLRFGDNENIDGVCLREGEIPLINLLRLFREKNDFARCPGFICRDADGNIFAGEGLPLSSDLDVFPFADFSGFELGGYKERALPISTSRGCIFRCTFCAESVSWERYRHRSAGNVFSEMEYQLNRYPGIKGFFFNDSLINGNINMLEELCNYIIEKGLRISWGGQGAIRKGMGPKLLEKMKKAGFSHVSYGLEHGSPRVLKLMRKGFDLNTAEEVIRATASLGINTTVNIVVGFPGETEEDVFAAADFLKKNISYINNVYFHALVVLPNTTLFNHREEYKIDLPPENGANLWFTRDGLNNYEIRLKRIEFLKQVVKDKYASNITEFNYYFDLAEDFYNKKDMRKALVYFLKAKSMSEEMADANKACLINNRLSALGKNA